MIMMFESSPKDQEFICVVDRRNFGLCGLVDISHRGINKVIKVDEADTAEASMEP